MCTVVVLHRADVGFPLAIVANRDEQIERPSLPPRLLRTGPRAVGGVDMVSGGTWLGVNEHGLFVGLTNQRTPDLPDRSRRSRGLLVTAALGARDPDEVTRMLASVDARAFNPFNLIFGVLGDVRVAYGREDRALVEVEPAPGEIVVLGNDRLDARDLPKLARAEERVRAALRTDEPLETALARALADHQKPPLPDGMPVAPRGRFAPEVDRELAALCIHLPFYGTVSASVLLFDARGRPVRYLHAPGPPCTTAFEDVALPFEGSPVRPAGSEP
jgi:uncharacterized protein with NRDE domain